MRHVECAFFDVDETIVNFKTMFSFLEFYMGILYGNVGNDHFNIYMNQVKQDWTLGKPREEINKEYYLNFKDKSYRYLNEVVDLWLDFKKKQLGNDFFIHKTISILKKLQKNNTKIVLVSGSLTELIKPIANELGVEHILATRFVIDGDVITGDIIPPQTIGEGKALAVKNFMKQHEINKLNSIAYGDHISDFPMLSAANHGIVISNDKFTQEKAIEHGFEIINW
ncbi:HAD family hydrolase [Obesumbacterium proteus]|uniref:HAD family hydrolase n=1 Tax=Obesumbacterium proteus TaxID=82983 RepID=UPI00242A54F1|nr:HAD-IB family hydrolase [Obesumbacterium proteus]